MLSLPRPLISIPLQRERVFQAWQAVSGDVHTPVPEAVRRANLEEDRLQVLMMLEHGGK